MTLRRMINPVMAYAWGGREAIAALQRRDRASEPEAELWMGAHPHASSTLESDDGSQPRSLEELITADPERYLGPTTLTKFGARLPFLLKVLSAAEPLSLQVHPNSAQAIRGFEAEEAAGIDRSASRRSYRDPYAKPEMIVALTRFEALKGFRPSAQAVALLESLDVELLVGLLGELRAGLSTGDAFLRLVEWPDAERLTLVAQTLAGAKAARAVDPEQPVFGWIELLAAKYPDDPGVVALSLLNYVVISPGQALIISPGEIHGYLHGAGVEILGGSDNVIRAGLTAKHISVRDLREILDRDSRELAVISPVLAGGEEVWPAPFEEFELSRVDLATSGAAPTSDVALARRGPEIVLCLSGSVDVADDDNRIALSSGESAFATATGGVLRASGTGVLVRATPKGDPSAGVAMVFTGTAAKVDR